MAQVQIPRSQFITVCACHCAPINKATKREGEMPAYRCIRIAIAVLSTLGAAALSSGCMTVSDNQNIVQSTNSAQTFANKKISLLPVKTQSSLAPDSVAGMRTGVSKRLGQSLKGKLPGAVVTDIPGTVDQLNQKSALPLYEQLVLTYENTGVLDKQKIGSLGRTLGADYLLFSRLKAEKLDIVISRGTGGSLDLSLIEVHTGEVAWAGSGEWKRGGIFGFGSATPDEVATGLVGLALASLR